MGDWDIFEGQFFEEFRDVPEHYLDRRFTHFIEPFPIPPDWKIVRSFDFGFRKPFSCDWWAIDYEGRAYLLLQLYESSERPFKFNLLQLYHNMNYCQVTGKVQSKKKKAPQNAEPSAK